MLENYLTDSQNRNLRIESLATKMAMVSPKSAQKIASLEREAGRQLLREKLAWKPFDDEVDLRQSILLDTVYDSLMFCTQKGFQWEHTTLVIKMVCEIIEQSKGKQIPAVVKLFTEKCGNCTPNVPSDKLKVFTQYFFSTFMAHFKLYQYVFTKQREDMIVSEEVMVETMDEPHQFSASKPEHIWAYEQKIHDLDEAAEKRQLERDSELDKAKSDATENLQNTLENIDNTDTPFTREKLLELISDLSKAHIGAASVSLNTAVNNVLEDLNYKLERTCVPRPADLGPPPRYQSKTPGGSKKREKSPKKSASRTGSRSSKTTL